MRNIPEMPNLVNYPHIVQSLNVLWGSVQCRHYLHGLVFNTTGRVNDNPKGFPLPVLSEINDLLLEHDRQYPQYTASGSVWEGEKKYRV